MENPPENPDEDYITDAKWVNEPEFQKMLDNKELLWDQGTMCALQTFRKYHQEVFTDKTPMILDI